MQVWTPTSLRCETVQGVHRHCIQCNGVEQRRVQHQNHGPTSIFMVKQTQQKNRGELQRSDPESSLKIKMGPAFQPMRGAPPGKHPQESGAFFSASDVSPTEVFEGAGVRRSHRAVPARTANCTRAQSQIIIVLILILAPLSTGPMHSLQCCHLTGGRLYASSL